MRSQASKVVLAVIIIAIVIGGGFYFWQQQNESSQPAENTSVISIMVPENYDFYRQKMTQFVQEGGEDPLKTMKFIKKELNVPYTSDFVKASAQAAAEEIAPTGGPPKASIAYLKAQNGTAYVLLDIDLDSWAGASVSLAIIYPLIEKTLLQFPEINRVVFNYAPEDK